MLEFSLTEESQRLLQSVGSIMGLVVQSPQRSGMSALGRMAEMTCLGQVEGHEAIHAS